MPFSIRPFHRVPVQGLTSIQSMKLAAIASSICLALTSLMVNAAEPLNSSPLVESLSRQYHSIQRPQTHNGVNSNARLLSALRRLIARCRVAISRRMWTETS